MKEIDGITFRPLRSESRLPLLAEPTAAGIDLSDWAVSHKEPLEDVLYEDGAILFRGFGISDQEKFARFSASASQLLDYVYRSTPRTMTAAKVYTSTEYPADSTIPMHCENAYKRDWPMKLFFYCAQPAREGGETPLGDVAAVTRRIAPEVKERFLEKKVMYVRNYGSGIDLPWQTVFQTEDREEVERYCEEHDIEIEWYKKDRLRTRQVCQAMASHPRSGDEVWFNQAHLFHVSSLDERTRESLLMLFKEDELPRNSYYGDGSALEPEVLEEIRAAFAEETVAFPWQKGDVLMVDNMAVAHGRRPFAGERKVLVTMGDLYSTVGRAVACSAA